MRCPVCNSTTFKGTIAGQRCRRCGYTHKATTDQETKFAKNYRSGSVDTNVIPLIDYHNVSYKFKILGEEGLKFPIEKNMRGWVQQWDYEEDFKALKTPTNVIIFLDKRFKIRLKSIKDIDKLDQKIKEKILVAAKTIQDKYHMVLDINNPVALRKEIKLLEGFKSPLLMQTENIKVVYPDGTVEFITAQAVQHFKNFFRNMAALDKVEDLENNLAEFAANFKLHQQVLNNMSDTLAKQTLVLEKISANSKSKIFSYSFNIFSSFLKSLGFKVLEKIKEWLKC